MVESEARAESDKQSLEKKITKEKEIIHKKVVELFKKTFDNAAEAELSLRQIQSKLKYHLISDIQIIKNELKNQNSQVFPLILSKILYFIWVIDYSSLVTIKFN